jgi:hypothetical protein
MLSTPPIPNNPQADYCPPNLRGDAWEAPPGFVENPLPATIRAELGEIANRLERADTLAHRAEVLGDAGQLAQAEQERRQAAAEGLIASRDLASLFLLLFRQAWEREPAVLSLLLAEALRTELTPLAEAVAQLEGRRR